MRTLCSTSGSLTVLSVPAVIFFHLVCSVGETCYYGRLALLLDDFFVLNPAKKIEHNFFGP